MKAATKLFTFTKPIIEKVHPIVLRTCKTIEDYIGCLDTDIHFTKVHTAADKQFSSYPIGNLLNRYDNIIIPEQGRIMWDLKEASQVTAFHPLAAHGVITGTCNQMHNLFPSETFSSNQKKPDVCQYYKKAHFDYKDSLGIDYKNIEGKTQMNGRNQVLIGTYERYTDIMDMYQTTLFLQYNLKKLKPLIDDLRNLAKRDDWNGQLFKFSENIHKFPENYLPPLYTTRKIHHETFKSEIQKKIIEAKIIMRARSKKAYELNIPEDNFNESHIQQLLSEIT